MNEPLAIVLGALLFALALCGLYVYRWAIRSMPRDRRRRSKRDHESPEHMAETLATAEAQPVTLRSRELPEPPEAAQ